MKIAKLTLLIILTFCIFTTIRAGESLPQCLKHHVLDCIAKDTQLGDLQYLDVEKLESYVTSLCNHGYAEVNGSDQECRSVCVIAQGAIENALTRMLQSGEVSHVTAFFLTPLPTTPLRKNGDTANLSSVYFEPARQYTLDMREHTLRALRDAGALIIAAYSQTTYDALKENEDLGSQQQVMNWETERQHQFVFDIPLNRAIPKELIGALYIIADQSGDVFFLPVQAIQAKSASDGESTWKKWLCQSSEHELVGTKHAINMFRTISINHRADEAFHLAECDVIR